MSKSLSIRLNADDDLYREFLQLMWPNGNITTLPTIYTIFEDYSISMSNRMDYYDGVVVLTKTNGTVQFCSVPGYSSKPVVSDWDTNRLRPFFQEIINEFADNPIQINITGPLEYNDDLVMYLSDVIGPITWFNGRKITFAYGAENYKNNLHIQYLELPTFNIGCKLNNYEYSEFKNLSDFLEYITQNDCSDEPNDIGCDKTNNRLFLTHGNCTLESDGCLDTLVYKNDNLEFTAANIVMKFGKNKLELHANSHVIITEDAITITADEKINN